PQTPSRGSFRPCLDRLSPDRQAVDGQVELLELEHAVHATDGRRLFPGHSDRLASGLSNKRARRIWGAFEVVGRGRPRGAGPTPSFRPGGCDPYIGARGGKLSLRKRPHPAGLLPDMTVSSR